MANTENGSFSALSFRDARERVVEAIKVSGAMKPPSFASFYASLLCRVSPMSVLEIGIHKGGSLRLWRTLLGDGAHIVCLDIKPEACAFAEGNADAVYCGSQVDADVLSRISAEHGPFDLICDDGSHTNPHMIFSARTLFPHVSKGGVYVVEDMFTSFWPSYGGGLGEDTSFMEYVKSLCDRMFSDRISQKFEKHFLGQEIPVIEQFADFQGLSDITVDSEGLTAFYKRS